MEIDTLFEQTLDFIQFKGVFDSYIEISKQKYYKIHGKKMQDEFRKRLEQGNLGFLPPKQNEDENENK